MHHRASGFTLIELMIVLAIITILGAVALPMHNEYRIRAAENACLAEMKNYTSLSMATLHNNGTPDEAPKAACSTAENATGIGEGIILTAAPHAPGVQNTECSMHTGNCPLRP